MLFFKRILSNFPTKIPNGMTAYNDWLQSIIELVDFEVDTDSIQWVISNEVMRLPTTSNKKPKAYFLKVLSKYASNQLAANTVNRLKAEQDAKQKSASEAAKLQQAADTTAETTLSGKGSEVN